MLKYNLFFLKVFRKGLFVLLCVTSITHAMQKKVEEEESKEKNCFGRSHQKKSQPKKYQPLPTESTAPIQSTDSYLKRTFTPTEITKPQYFSFPEEVKSIQNAIRQGSTKLFIYIPEIEDRKLSNAGSDFPLFTTKEVNLLEEFTLQLYPHMMREENCYLAAYPLKNLVRQAQNLKKVTISHNLAKYFLPLIPKGVSTYIDCAGIENVKETIMPPMVLEGRRKDMISFCSKKYPASEGYNITVLELSGIYKKK
ncbi:MAG: hypothetical protein FJX71_00700 [Alphaproteobacteria bacterium]|nr:hypothetical protein [Alphaproteobacteria bacterium]